MVYGVGVAKRRKCSNTSLKHQRHGKLELELTVGDEEQV